MFMPKVEKIPQDILQLIFSLLDDSAFKNLAQVNRFFNSAAINAGLPRLGACNLYLQDFIFKYSHSTNAISLLPDEKIAIGLHDGRIVILDYKNNAVIKTIEGYSQNRKDPEVLCVLHLGAGKIATSAYDSCLRIYDYETGEYQKKIVGYSVKSMAMLGTNQIGLGHYKGGISILDINSLQCIQYIKNCNHMVLGLTNLSENELASSSQDGIVRIWNYKTGQSISSLSHNNVHCNWANSVINLENDRIGSCHDDGFRVWNRKTGECLKTLVVERREYDPDILVADQIRGIMAEVKCFRASKCSKNTVICQYGTGVLRQWNYETGECLRVFVGNANTGFYTMPTYEPPQENQIDPKPFF